MLGDTGKRADLLMGMCKLSGPAPRATKEAVWLRKTEKAKVTSSLRSSGR